MGNQKWFNTYIYIWAGQFVSMITSYAVQFASVIWLSLEYQSAEILAYAGIAGMLPQALIGPFAGVYIDRINRKRIMIASDTFIALCAIVLIFILKSETVNLIWMYILLGLRSVGNAFHSPALQALAPLIVPPKEMLRVAGINQLLHSICSIGGPALGTLAIAILPISDVLYLDLIGALLAISALMMVIIPDTVKKTSDRSISAEFLDGLHIVSKNQGLSSLFLFAMAITFVIMPSAIMFPLLTTGHYGGGKWEMGLIEIVWGGGMLIGGAVLGIYKIGISKVVLVNFMYILLGLTFLLSGVFPNEWFIGFILVTAIGGVSLSVFYACFTAIVQIAVKPEMLGRVFSLYYSLAVLPSIIGLLLTGLIAENSSVNSTFIISGCLAIAVGLLSFCSPTLMQLDK
ncbi:MFS transporter [Arundinibacter roseus]|uniref:MFS transporter n=1 Tax=Arundinibacter roseus TaxID=2070510 RepID=A0A4V2X997_9BACT|nr:MFS transporter [Arundinibacter roseus]TDB62795.1 MFS transporter [Arundinibacter roseus]